MENSIETLNGYIENASRCFYCGFEGEGNHYLEKCISWLLDWSVQKDMSDTDMQAILIEIQQAQIRRDIVWIADLLLYRLMPMIMKVTSRRS